jgi:glycosyltransferase involved in cell wall biosynthesis/SAM-dependent methyltransferase
VNTAISCFLESRKLGVDFDVVEAPDWMAEGLILALLDSKPLVVHLHTPSHLIVKHNCGLMGWDQRLSDRLEQLAARRAHVITSPSYLLARSIEEGGWIGNRHVRVIRYPIDLCRWAQVPEPSGTFPVVLLVGRQERLKAPEIALKAAAKLSREIENLELVMVGRSSGEREGQPYREWVKGLARHLAVRCRFVEQVPRNELPAWYAAARVVAVPSRYDNFPMAGLEALAAGRPVVCTATTGLSEVVDRSGAGTVVPPGDPDALAAALRPFLIDPASASRAGSRARDVVSQSCDPTRIASERERAYEDAIAAWGDGRVRKAGGFPRAARNAGELSPTWKAWATRLAAATPWKHFYLRTAEQLLCLLAHHPYFRDRLSLGGTQALDVGCTPAVSVLLACLGARVVLLDNALDELEKGRRFAKDLGVESRVECVRADAFRSPFREKSFHLVWNSGFIEHFDNPVGIVGTMASLVMPGGAVCVLTPAAWTLHSMLARPWVRFRRGYHWDQMGRERSYSPATLAKILGAAGVKALASSRGNVRRALLDDHLALRWLEGAPLRRLLYALMNTCDLLETRLPVTARLGFMAGAIGLVA